METVDLRCKERLDEYNIQLDMFKFEQTEEIKRLIIDKTEMERLVSSKIANYISLNGGFSDNRILTTIDECNDLSDKIQDLENELKEDFFLKKDDMTRSYCLCRSK